MAMEQQEQPKQESSTLSKVLWGAAITGAAVGAVMATPSILNGVGSVAQSAADYFTTPGGASVGSSIYTGTGTALNNFADGAKDLSANVSKILAGGVANADAAATAVVETTKEAVKDGSTIEAVKDAAGKVGGSISNTASAMWENPGATATIAGSALAGAGVGVGVKNWAQRVGSKKQDYDTMAARIEAERTQGVTGPAIG